MTVFVDTNVLVYARDAGMAAKQGLAQGWIERLWATSEGRVSTQVLNEYYVTVTRKLAPAMTRVDARADVRDLLTWKPVVMTGELMARAWLVEERFGFTYRDALIVAAAQASNCPYLLTEDLQDEQDLDGVVIINPFDHGPDEVMGARP